jgi:hypothetical protein
MNALKFIQIQTSFPAVAGPQMSFSTNQLSFSKDILIEEIYCDFVVTDAGGLVKNNQSLVELNFSGGNVGTVPSSGTVGGWSGGSFVTNRIGFIISNGFKSIKPKIIVPQGVAFIASVTLYCSLVLNDPIIGHFRIAYR